MLNILEALPIDCSECTPSFLLPESEREKIRNTIVLPEPPTTLELAESIRDLGIPTSPDAHPLKGFFTPWVDVESFRRPTRWVMIHTDLKNNVVIIQVSLGFCLKRHGLLSGEQASRLDAFFNSFKQTIEVPIVYAPKMNILDYDCCGGSCCNGCCGH